MPDTSRDKDPSRVLPNSLNDSVSNVLDEETHTMIQSESITDLIGSEEDVSTDEIENIDMEDEKYFPRFCYWRILSPYTCFFKVHGGLGKIPALTDGQWATLFACCL